MSRHAFIEVVPAVEQIRIFGVHLSAVHAAWTEQRRVYELRALLRSVARHQEGFHVLAGDFNTIAADARLDIGRVPLRVRAFLWLTGGRIRWETVQILLDAGYVDSYRFLHPGDPGYTFPTWDPHVRLDYAFVPTPLKDRLKRCVVIYDAPALKEASDHFPLLFEIE